MTHRIGSVCSGYEGLGMAVQSVMGGELAWVADNDPGASAILAHRFPSVPNLGDITEVCWGAVEPVDVVTAGFPCQDVSCAGGRAGLREGNRTGVWAHVARAINELRPSLVVLENVRGLLSAGADSDVEPCPWCLGEAGNEHPLRALGAVLGDLADLGYDARWTVVSAADAGAPHRRERVFIVAADASGGELQRRGGSGVLGSAPPAEFDEGDQRQRAGDAAGDSGSATSADAAGERWAGLYEPRPHLEHHRPEPAHTGAHGRAGGSAQDADCAASGERRLAAPGQAAGGRPWADAGGSGGAPTTADPRGEGLEVGTVEPDRDERQATERGCGDDTPADAYGPDAGSHAGGGRDEAPAGPGDGPERRREPGSGIGGGAPADADGRGRGLDGECGRQGGQGEQFGLRAAQHEPGDIAWGAYALAIRRWEHATSRPAPRPTEPGRTGERLSPRFVEWMMGLPEGWVTDVPGLSRNAQLKALGNGVVPAQAAMALRLLLDRADIPSLVADRGAA